MNGGLHGDMVRTLNNALAQAVEATTAVEKERDDAIQCRQLMAMSLATTSDKAAELQALLEQERTAAASQLESLSAEHEAEREAERGVRRALEEELEASRQRADKLDSELWRNAEQTVDAGSRLGGLQQEAAQAVTVCWPGVPGSGWSTGLCGRPSGPSCFAGWCWPVLSLTCSLTTSLTSLHSQVAEQRELCQKAQAALAAARAQLATPPPLPLEAELQRERREWQATAAQMDEELAAARRQAAAAMEAQAEAEAEAAACRRAKAPSAEVKAEAAHAKVEAAAAAAEAETERGAQLRGRAGDEAVEAGREAAREAAREVEVCVCVRAPVCVRACVFVCWRLHPCVLQAASICVAGEAVRGAGVRAAARRGDSISLRGAARAPLGRAGLTHYLYVYTYTSYQLADLLSY